MAKNLGSNSGLLEDYKLSELYDNKTIEVDKCSKPGAGAPQLLVAHIYCIVHILYIRHAQERFE